MGLRQLVIFWEKELLEYFLWAFVLLCFSLSYLKMMRISALESGCGQSLDNMKQAEQLLRIYLSISNLQVTGFGQRANP